MIEGKTDRINQICQWNEWNNEKKNERMNRINRRKFESKIGPKQWPIRNKTREKPKLKKNKNDIAQNYTQYVLIAIESINVLTTHLVHIHIHTYRHANTNTDTNEHLS